MTVKELIDALSKLDQNKEVYVWNCEWDSKDPVNEIEVDHAGDIIIL
jgi:hypothetical protein